MTSDRLKLPVAIATGMVVYAWFLTIVPDMVSLSLRGAIGFLMVVLILRHSRITLEHNDYVKRMLTETLEVVNRHESDRAQAVKALELRADALAEIVARATETRHRASASALDAQTERLEAKIQEGTEASREAQREANDVNQKIANLDKRLLDAIPPKDQIDDIQNVSHESRDIIAAVDKKVGKS